MIKLPNYGGDLNKLHKWLTDNKRLLTQQKKSAMKLADSFVTPATILYPHSGNTIKAENGAVSLEAKSIIVKAVINTTRLFDSHQDVHIDGLWNKSIKESKINYHVKQHDFSFDGIISDEVKVSAVTFTWKDLGFPEYDGETQALVYESTINADDKTGMFEKYIKGKVREHSVGMRYISLGLAVDNKRYEEEKKLWDKYYPIIVNKEDVDPFGYFWAVTEAKNNEGSAVVKGANFVTPTISVEESGQPLEDTGEKSGQPTFNMDKFLNNYQPKKFIK